MENLIGRRIALQVLETVFQKILPALVIVYRHKFPETWIRVHAVCDYFQASFSVPYESSGPQILIGGNNTTASSVQYSDGPVGQFRCDAVIRIGQDEMWQLRVQYHILIIYNDITGLLAQAVSNP